MWFRTTDEPAATRAMVVVGGLAAVLVLVWHCYAVPLGTPYYGLFSNDLDLEVYRAGGEVWRRHAALYDGPVIYGMEFTYPPFAALVFVVLTVAGMAVTKVLWWVATMVALVLLVWRCLRSLRYRNCLRTWVFAVELAVVCTALEPVRSTIWLGQINVFLVLAVIWDLTREPSARLRGVGVGLAAGIKLTPAFFLVYLAWTRQWRTLFTAAAAFATTIAIGFAARPDDAKTFWSQRVIAPARVGPVDSPANQSINGFLAQMSRFLDIEQFAVRNADAVVFVPPTWLWLAVAVPVAVLGLLAAALAYRTGHPLLAATVAGMTSAAVSPFSWAHHWVWLVPLLILALHQALSERSRWWTAAPLIIGLVGFCWWWNYSDQPPLFGADHPIGIGLFMLPREDIPEWWSYLAVPLYAGCYPLLLIVTAVFVIRRYRRSVHRWPQRVRG
ncbi:glycosyltransferase 87 family protein [Nocardia sp. XZ_19_385]|uniref:glycosyltransferase 87 family protein n=1 Tax=Nocardia sp. XZ_19_385 TaxID=2769488 RepID=UPI00188F0453|nr:glycosyltransferase 87 family protein [Nocardia sp. XZ_19_385]